MPLESGEVAAASGANCYFFLKTQKVREVGEGGGGT